MCVMSLWACKSSHKHGQTDQRLEQPPAALTDTRDPLRAPTDVLAKGMGVDVRLWVLSPPSGAGFQLDPTLAPPVPRGVPMGASAILPDEPDTNPTKQATNNSGPSTDDGPPDLGNGRVSPGVARPATTTKRPAPPSTSTPSTRRGSWIRRVAAADARATLEGLAREFDQVGNPSLDPAIIEAWRRNGMRVVRIPADRLPVLRERLGLIAPEQQQLIGFSSSRVPIVRGTSFPRSEALELDTGVLTVESGHLRLLLRSWPVPKPMQDQGGQDQGGLNQAGLDQANSAIRTAKDRNAPHATADVRFEVTPQALVDSAASRGFGDGASAVARDANALNPLSGFGISTSIASEDAGPMFKRLTLEASVSAGDAILIFPALKETDVNDRSGASPSGPKSIANPNGIAHLDSRIAPPHDDASPAPKIVARSDVGPDVPALASLGEALLTDALATSPRGDWLVLVLIPKPPATYTLLR